MRNNSHACLFSLCIQTYNSSSSSAKYSDSVFIFISPYLSVSQKFVEKVAIGLQHSQLSVLQDKEACNDWFFMIDFRFGKLYLLKLVVDMSRFLENFIADRCMCLFIIRILCNWMVTAIHNLIAIRAVCKQTNSFCNGTGIRTLVFLTTSFDSGMQKDAKTFPRSVLNEAMNFVDSSPLSK